MSEEINFTGPVKLGKYMIKSELGHGSMGIVYEGFDPFIERAVALKTIRKDLLNTKEADNLIARFRREAQAAGRLNHPNIVAVYDYDEDGDTVFIAMEFVQGRPLKECFDNNERFDLTDIIRIMSQVLGALSYAHENGVVHRDIKPANIILTDNAQIKITDFGIAHIESSNLTQTGMIMGTPNYMSPEQFMGNRVDGRSDIFSAGVMLYQFVTGENPFDGRTMATIMHKVLSAEPVNPADLNINISSDLNGVIKKAIAKKPEDRFQNAEEFFTAINRALQNDPPGKVPAHPVIETGSDPGATVIISSPNTINPHKQAETINSLNSSDESAESAVSSDSGSKIKWLFAGLIIILLTAGGMFFLFSNKEKSYGYINIFTKPYVEMYLDEKFLGKTPKSGLKLPAGQINVRFINKSYNIDVTEQIHVKPDETVRISFKWK